MKKIVFALAANMLALSSSLAAAQGGPSASTIGSGAASDGSATIGTGGSAAAGSTSASTLGLGGTSTGPAGTSSTVAGAGSAAAVDGKASARNKVIMNKNMQRSHVRAKAQDGGTWSKSMTTTSVRHGETLDSRTKSMSHVPGGAPAKSTSRQHVKAGR